MMLNDEHSVLFIDDDAGVLGVYTLLLGQEGRHASACSGPSDARNRLQANWPGIALSDVRMPSCNGIDLVMLLHRDDNQLPTLLTAGYDDTPMVVDAVKKGAWNFLQKPVDPGRLLVSVEDALWQREPVIAYRRYCQQEFQVGSVGYSGWVNWYHQRLRQPVETDIAV